MASRIFVPGQMTVWMRHVNRESPQTRLLMRNPKFRPDELGLNKEGFRIE
jgi:hypothetical protein